MPNDDAYKPDEPPAPPPDPAAVRFGRFRPADDGTYSDRLLDRPVTLRAAPLAEADALQAEARFLARMQHPALPCVYDFVRDDAEAALVLPPVAGLTLTAAVAARANGQLVPAIADPTACVLSFIAVCDALRAAHLRGVVHGALTPDCIALADDGRVVVEGWARAMKSVQRPLTMRFCAHVPVPVELAADDLHQDIRGLGACLYLALVGETPPLATDGRLAPLSAAATARIPGALLAIVRRALASNAAGGFASVAALRAALAGHLAGLAPPDDQAAGPGLMPRLRAAAAVLLVIAVLAGVVLAFSWRSVSSYATWGAPIVEEDFTGEAWKTRWGSRGRWEHKDGRVESRGSWDNALMLKQRLSPPVAIEYTGRFGEARPGDLSVWWCEDDPFALRADDDVDNPRAWFVQAGAYDNSWCTIWQTPERLRQEVCNLVLEPDRDHRFRVEVHSDRLLMWIDGRQVMEHRPFFPIGAGTIGLYTWDPGKQFDDVRIWQQEVPEQVSPLTVGDEAFRAGRYADAAAAYGRVATSHKGRPLGVEALYYQGLALHRAGSKGLARKVWEAMPDVPLRRRAECLAIDDMFAEGDMRNAIARFTQMWRERPEVHASLRQRWQVCGQELRKAKPIDKASMRQWIRLRDDTFGDDPPSRWLVVEMLNLMGEWEEMVQRCTDEKRALARALIALGRNAEVIAADWAKPSERIRARINDGDIEGVLDQVDSGTRAGLLCKLGRPEEAKQLQPYPAALYLGGVEELLARDALGNRTNSALIVLGRLEDAAGPGVPGLRLSGKDTSAMLLLGRLDEAERLGTDVRLHRFFAHHLAGRLDEARALLPLSFPHHRNDGTMWFGHVIGGALIDEVLGTAGALRKAVQDGTAYRTGWGGRCAKICEAILDPAKEAAIQSWPWRSESAAWLQVVRAVRGELAGDPAAAREGWLGFKSLPSHQRLLEGGHGISAELEGFVAWRIAVLAQAPR